MEEEPRPRPAARPAPRRRVEPEEEMEYADMPEAGLDLRQGRRTAKRGALWLQLAFLFALIPYVIFAVMFFAVISDGAGGRGGAAVSSERQFATGLVIGMSALYLIPVIFIAVGATVLANLKARGLVITACILCFIVAVQLLVYTIIWIGVFAQTARYSTGMAVMMPLLVAATSFLGFVLTIVGGILGLVTASRAAVKAAFRNAGRG